MTFGWGPSHIRLHNTLEGPWPHYMILEVSWDGLWTLSFGFSQFHGHGSWRKCGSGSKKWSESVDELSFLWRCHPRWVTLAGFEEWERDLQEGWESSNPLSLFLYSSLPICKLLFPYTRIPFPHFALIHSALSPCLCCSCQKAPLTKVSAPPSAPVLVFQTTHIFATLICFWTAAYILCWTHFHCVLPAYMHCVYVRYVGV